jgi:uncharacterized protein (TIGR03435 family)
MKTYVLAGRIAGLVLVMSALCAQSNAPAPAFEVASIRPADLPTPGAFRGGPPPQFRAGMQLDGSRLDWGLASLADMIEYAFRVKNYQVSGPDWMRSSRWNILARLPEGASQNQAPEMMQALLRDRFQLKFHREKREQPVYALEVAKGGPKLESISPPDDASPAPATAGTQAPGLFPGPFGGPFGRGPVGPPPDAPDGRGGRGPGPIMMTTTGANGATARISPGDNCSLHLELSKLTMQDFADTLTPFLDKPVIDATELKGRYKATLDLPMEVMLTMMQNMMRANGLPGPGVGGFGRGPGDGGPDGRGPGDGGPGGRGFPGGCDPGAVFANGGADASNAPIFQAVQKLGLKLEARKAPFDTIIVDHLEKTPSEN